MERVPACGPLSGDAESLMRQINDLAWDCSTDEIVALLEGFAGAVCDAIRSARVTGEHVRAALECLEHAASREGQTLCYEACVEQVMTCADETADQTSSIGDSVEFIGSRGLDPQRHWPHRRADCLNVAFGRGFDIKYCDMCWCVVCDVPAGNCMEWHAHCSRTSRQAQASAWAEVPASRAGEAAERRRRAAEPVWSAADRASRRVVDSHESLAAAAQAADHGSRLASCTQPQATTAVSASTESALRVLECAHCRHCGADLDEMHAMLGCG